MADNHYLSNVTQTNGCRVWLNPIGDLRYPIPNSSNELYIRNIPKEFSEADLLPHFERFGPVYQFRLLVEVSISLNHTKT
jgi:RNA recognition motif-containing protein